MIDCPNCLMELRRSNDYVGIHFCRDGTEVRYWDAAPQYVTRLRCGHKVMADWLAEKGSTMECFTCSVSSSVVESYYVPTVEEYANDLRAAREHAAAL